ncbi:MAG: AraC family transcriptional regulator [Bacillota bacterium]|nr:AraC family transcriptional regulator [Bacillota bacterium]
MVGFKKISTIKKSIIFSWLLYYALILIVPVLISVFTYLKTANVVQNEINSSNMLFLKRIQQQMDILLNDARRLSMEVSLNTSVNNLLNLKNIGDTKNYPYDIYRAVRDLSSYKIPNSSIDDFYVYFKNIDCVISPNSANSSKTYFDVYFNHKEISYDKWLKTLSGNYKGDFIILNDTYSQSNAKNTIIYVKTIPYINQYNTSANIVMCLDGSKFIQDAKEISLLNKGTLLILNKTNNVVISSRANYDSMGIKYENLVQSSGMIHQKANGNSAVISYITSEAADWKFLSIIPEAIFWEKYDYIRKLTFLGIFICLIVCAVITYFSLKNNYNPVIKLIQLLENRNGLKFDKKNNEFSFIQEAINQVYKEKEDVDNLLIQQNKVLRSNFLARLLKGSMGKLPIQNLLSMYDVNFISQYFGVMVFYIEDINEKLVMSEDKDKEINMLENFKLIQVIMSDIIEGIIKQKNNGFMIEIDEMMVCLINFKEKGIDIMKREMTEASIEAKRLLKDNYNINFKVALSNIHETYTGIPEAYNEAIEALEYNRFLEIEDIFHFEDIKVVEKGNYYYPLEIEQQLINSIKVGDFEKSKGILNEIFQNNFEKTVLSIKISRCLMFDLVSTMIKIVNDICIDPEEKFLEEFNPIDRLLKCESINEMKVEMDNILSWFCIYINERNKKKSKNKALNNELRLKDLVMEYVNNNYKDFNLSITSIADQFDIHPINLSKIFLEQSGETLLDFINKVRIREAKKLFYGNYNNLDEISKEVGYSNSRTFTRIFKKFEGVTPGKYKDSIGFEI